jgi:hypothetical protein
MMLKMDEEAKFGSFIDQLRASLLMYIKLKKKYFAKYMISPMTLTLQRIIIKLEKNIHY